MKNTIRKLTTLLLTLVFLFSMLMYVKQLIEKSSAGSTYTEALALATSRNKAEVSPEEKTVAQTDAVQPVELTWIPAPVEEEDPCIAELEQMDLEALREVNPDVVGWIRIPDTEINYPLMQGEDNEYYLERTWNDQKSVTGSIFLEHLNSAALTDFNTIVYGHNMQNGSMFAGIRKFNTQQYWEDHPYVYIRSDLGVYRYEIFSSYLADVDGSTYGLAFSQEETRTRFLANARENSVIETNISPEATDRILTLSTCSGMGYTTRWVVHARLKMIQTEQL